VLFRSVVVSNPDLTHPGPDRLPVLETGAILQLFRACIPDLAFKVVGKPSRIMFDIALERFGSHGANTVMIGDNPETDGAGAISAGITPILVGPGQRHSSIAALL
jgi:ribonucleotide monophosphatase NagD (HAD superfamily)